MTARRDLFVYGAGGHGKVVADAARATGLFDVRGFLDDDPARAAGRLLGLPVRGGADTLASGLHGAAVALGVGANRSRLSLLEPLRGAGVEVVTVVHPSATVCGDVVLGTGTYIAPLAVVHTAARLGRASIVNSGAVVEHDNALEDGVHVSPNATLGGDVTLGTGAHVGLGAVVLPGLTVGSWAVVGAGAVVIRDVTAGETVVGVPARPLGRAGVSDPDVV